MKFGMTVLGVGAAFFFLWILALRCRRGHRLWPELRRWRYAHRGLHDGAAGIPENSLAAFRCAVEGGYGAELDVHLTKDGRLAVVHDDSLQRMCGANLRVSQSTAAELEALRLAGTSERIPFLEEVLPLFAGRAPLIVELKVDGHNAAALCRAATELLDQSAVTYCVESFHPLAVRWLKRHRPDICRGQLSQNFLRERSGLHWAAAWGITNLLTNFLTQPDFVAFRYEHRDTLAVRLCRRVWGPGMAFWTLRSMEDVAQCEREGAIPIFEKEADQQSRTAVVGAVQ